MDTDYNIYSVISYPSRFLVLVPFSNRVSRSESCSYYKSTCAIYSNGIWNKTIRLQIVA